MDHHGDDPQAAEPGAAELHALIENARPRRTWPARAPRRPAGRLRRQRARRGPSLDLLLALAARVTGADRRMLIAAGETLAHMPATATLYEHGQLSWGQIRAITTAARRLPAHTRAQLDERIAATEPGAASLTPPPSPTPTTTPPQTPCPSDPGRLTKPSVTPKPPAT